MRDEQAFLTLAPQREVAGYLDANALEDLSQRVPRDQPWIIKPLGQVNQAAPHGDAAAQVNDHLRATGLQVDEEALGGALGRGRDLAGKLNESGWIHADDGRTTRVGRANRKEERVRVQRDGCDGGAKRRPLMWLLLERGRHIAIIE